MRIGSIVEEQIEETANKLRGKDELHPTRNFDSQRISILFRHYTSHSHNYFNTILGTKDRAIDDNDTIGYWDLINGGGSQVNHFSNYY